MRIVALPLTTRATKASSSHLSNAVLPLTYYHFQPPSQQKADDKREQSIVKRVMNKAADTWSSWGKAPQGNWKVCDFAARKCRQKV